MSQYNAQPDSTAENAGWEASAPELAPFHPTTNQSGGWNPPARAGAGQPVRSKAALPPNVESMSLHAKAGSTGAASWLRNGDVQLDPTNWDEDTRRGGSARHSRVESNLSHTCTACSTSFPNNYKLEQHATKNKHKAYVCTCGKAFTKLSALRRHFEESTQAREHQCPLCDNEFKRPGHVEQHLRLVHKKPNDVIKDLLSAQKSQPPQGTGEASTASAAVPMTGSMDTQTDYPIANPGGLWTGPIDFSAPAPAPADYPGSRPVYPSAFLSAFSAPGPGHMTGASAFAPQSFMTQTPDFPAYPAYPAGAVASRTGLFANSAPDFAGYPAAHLDGDLGLLNVDTVLASMNTSGSFEMPALETEFMGELFDLELNPFDL